MQRLIDLLDTKNQAQHQMVANEQDAQGGNAEVSIKPAKLGSFNLLLSRRALHLIPRSREEYTLPGDWAEVNGTKLGKLSVNAMGTSSNSCLLLCNPFPLSFPIFVPFYLLN